MAIISCPKCSMQVDARDASCPYCGRTLTAVDVKSAAEAAAKASGIPPDDPVTKHILVTTETSGLPVKERKGVVAAECILGTNIFKDVLTDVRNIVGGRAGSAQNSLRQARLIALNELRHEAHELGANAVIAVTFSYNEIAEGGKMFMVVATGTAVVI
jgi:uncharacterized protein YbjQ (UPF0145 family)